MENLRMLGAALAAALLAGMARAQLVIDVSREGAEKIPVSVEVGGESAFAKSLKRNLELTGAFVVRPNGVVRVTGQTGGAIRAEGRGKALGLSSRATDAKAARAEARALADRMSEAYANRPGFARDPIAFVSREGRAAELCVSYPDGYDLRRLTNDRREAVGPRWRGPRSLFYTGFLNGGPQIFELDTATGRRTMKWSFRGLTTGATVSPDGNRVAIILSLHGNPELYVIDMAANSWVRLTHTANASEGQPAWSPDGREIVYVSDESRYPQLYVIDVATRRKRRLTSKGSQNVDPDWGPDGRIAYLTKRGGQAQVAVIDPKAGEASTRLVTEPGAWEHPSWARDARHVVASRDNALFVVDTDERGDAPTLLFPNAGTFLTPAWCRF